MNWHCYTWYRGLKVKLRQRESNFKTSWLPCEVKSAFGWWVRFWRAGIEHGKFLCKTNHGLIFVAQSKLIAFWKTWTFHGFGQMCLFEVLGKWWSILDNPSQKLTELVPFFEINSTVFFCNIALGTIYTSIYQDLKVKRNRLYMGSKFKRFWLPYGAKSVFR